MRIIAGKNKGTTLFELKHLGTRPTADRVREALFSKLQNEIQGSVVLDLFAGTGALGFEALSRGASKVFLVDNNKESYNLIVKNNKKLQQDAICLNMDFKLTLKIFINKNIKFDIIFIDPPYATNLGEEALLIIANNSLLNENGTIVFEHNKDKLNFNLPLNLRVFDQKKYGITYLTFITNA